MTGVIQGRAQDSTDLEALEALGDGTSRPVAVHGGLDTQATIGLVGAGASPRAREWGAVTSGTAVMIAQSSTNVIVRNARLSGGARGIHHPAGGTLADITIENVEVENTDQAGIQFRSVSQVEIMSCQVETVTNGPGISVLNSSNVEFGGRLVSNTVHNVGGNGSELFNLRGGILRGNVISWYSRAGAHEGGIYISAGSGSTGGTLIKENTITQSANGAAGIRIRGTSMNVRPDGNLIVQNVIRWINGPGIRCSSNLNHIRENTIANYNWATPNDAGILIESEHTNDGDWNSIEANLIGLNIFSECGILFAAGTEGNTYRDNVIRHTPGGTVCDNGSGNTDAGGNVP